MTKYKTEETLATELAAAEQQVIIGAIYKHYKRGDDYKVTGLVILEASDEVGVVYEAQYEHPVTYVRPLSSWLEKVNWQGKFVDRFSLQRAASGYGASAYTSEGGSS